MSYYIPDPDAVPNGTSLVRFLVPVNYVNLPGITLTSACFPSRQYEGAAAAKCFSNLLAIGIRLFVVDLYWDASRRLWSLCPVELADGGSPFNSTASSAAQSPGTTATSLASGNLVDRENSRTLSLPASQSVTTGANPPSASTTMTLGSTVSTSAFATGSTPTSGPDQALMQIGPYSCTTSANFELLADVLSAYLANTETDLNATIKYVIMNLHAAASSSDPSGPPLQPSADELPRDGNLLSSVILRNNSAYLYTPAELGRQRQNLNTSSSWFGAEAPYQPHTAYFGINEANGHASTGDGWPSESIIELVGGKRLLAGYGRVDPQLSGYNFSGDASSIFPQGYMSAPDEDSARSTDIQSTCLFQPGVYDLSRINSSWATFTIGTPAASPALLAAEAANITECGLTPILNETIGNVSAAEDYRPYSAFVNSTTWSWADGEPRNISRGDSNSDVNCAALNATSGRLVAADCGQSHYPACRLSNQPYRWEVGSSKGEYMNVDIACHDDSRFDVPRTALENSYLRSAWRDYLSHQDDPDDTLLWVNFNDIDAKTCWVIGQNATCHYLPRSSGGNQQVAVPTVAAVIVFVLTGLTLFVKCAANRQSSRRRRRRRADDGWDYEGVPS